MSWSHQRHCAPVPRRLSAYLQTVLKCLFCSEMAQAKQPSAQVQTTSLGRMRCAEPRFKRVKVPCHQSPGHPGPLQLVYPSLQLHLPTMQAVLGSPALPGPAFVCSSKSHRPARRLVARAAQRQDNDQPEGAGSQKPAAWKGALLGAALAPLVVSPRRRPCAVHRLRCTMNTHAGRSTASGCRWRVPPGRAPPATHSSTPFKCRPCACPAGRGVSPGRGCGGPGVVPASRPPSLPHQRAPAAPRAPNSN